MMSPSEKIRKHFIFYGDVQGVGFRYTARHTAQRYGITGWVRNLYDGSVEMEAEGFPRDIAAMVRDLEQHTWGNVDRTESNLIQTEGGYGFEIR